MKIRLRLLESGRIQLKRREEIEPKRFYFPDGNGELFDILFDALNYDDDIIIEFKDKNHSE